MYKKSFVFLGIVFLIGVIAGVIYYYKTNESIVTNLQINLTEIKFNSNIIYHIIFLSIILFFSIFVLGSIIGLFLFFYEALSIGFIITMFFNCFGLSGMFYSIIYVIIFKFVYVLLLSIIVVKSFKLSRNVVGYFVLKKDESFRELIIINFIKIIKLSASILLYDIFLVFLGNYILSIFNFLI